MKYIEHVKKGNNFEVEIDPVKLQAEIDRLYEAIKLHHLESQELHRQLAEAEAVLKSLPVGEEEVI